MKKTVCCIMLAAALMIALGGCARMSLVDAYKLNKVEFGTTNVNRLSVAVQIPDYFQFQNEGVVMTMTLKKTRNKPAVRERFVLQQIPASRNLKDFARYQGKAVKVYAFRIRPADISRFEHIRRQTRDNGTGGKRSGSMTVETKVCRNRARLPSSVLVSIFLKAQETGEYVAMVRDMDLLSQAGFNNVKKSIPPCEKK